MLIDYFCQHNTSWLINQNGHFNSYFNSFTDVQSSRFNVTSNTWQIGTYGIVNYDRKFTESDISSLNSRPKVTTDFQNAKTTAVAENFYVWGESIGYNGCKNYWPDGSVCPSAKYASFEWSVTPAPEMSLQGCYIGRGVTGYWVNGALVSSWGDSTSYKGEGIWHQVAGSFEKYVMDPCMGHASNGKYHHHSYSICLGERLNEHGMNHSRIYGWAIDGYPIYGPFNSEKVLATSCWQRRNYSSSSVTGCPSGQRTCILKDQFDFTKGVVTASRSGPSLDNYVSAQGNVLIKAESGIYFQDFFYNKSCYDTTGTNMETLNEYNGHDHGDLGFHYHVTVDADMKPVFPYVVGPKYYGCLPKSVSCCGTIACTVFSTSTCGSSTGLPHTSSSAVYCTAPPTPVPTPVPSNIGDTLAPTMPIPTRSPTLYPSAPSPKPTKYPSLSPSNRPSCSPSAVPSLPPSPSPTSQPTFSPTVLSPVVHVVFDVSLVLYDVSAGGLSSDPYAVDELLRAFKLSLSSMRTAPYQVTLKSITSTSNTRRETLLSGGASLSSNAASLSANAASVVYAVEYVVQYDEIVSPVDGISSAKVESMRTVLSQHLTAVSSSTGMLVSLLSISSSKLLQRVTAVSQPTVTKYAAYVGPGIAQLVTPTPAPSLSPSQGPSPRPSSSKSKGNGTSLSNSNLIIVVVVTIGGVFFILCIGMTVVWYLHAKAPMHEESHWAPFFGLYLKDEDIRISQDQRRCTTVDVIPPQLQPTAVDVNVNVHYHAYNRPTLTESSNYLPYSDMTRSYRLRNDENTVKLSVTKHLVMSESYNSGHFDTVGAGRSSIPISSWRQIWLPRWFTGSEIALNEVSPPTTIWRRAFHPTTQEEYYYNKDTGESSWVVPEGGILESDDYQNEDETAQDHSLDSYNDSSRYSRDTESGEVRKVDQKYSILSREDALYHGMQRLSDDDDDNGSVYSHEDNDTQTTTEVYSSGNNNATTSTTTTTTSTIMRNLSQDTHDAVTDHRARISNSRHIESICLPEPVRYFDRRTTSRSDRLGYF